MDKDSIAYQKYEKMLNYLAFKILIFLVYLDLSGNDSSTSIQSKPFIL